MNNTNTYVMVNAFLLMACVYCATTAVMNGQSSAPIFITIAFFITIELLITKIGVERTKRFIHRFRNSPF